MTELTPPFPRPPKETSKTFGFDVSFVSPVCLSRFNDSPLWTNNRCILRNVKVDKRPGSNFCARTNLTGPHNYRPCSNKNVIAYADRVIAYGNVLIDSAIISYYRSLMYHDSHRMRNFSPSSNLNGRRNHAAKSKMH